MELRFREGEGRAVWMMLSGVGWIEQGSCGELSDGSGGRAFGNLHHIVLLLLLHLLILIFVPALVP